MVDYEAIGRRIAEQRKYFHKVSQEKMAEDLGMYQADISNLEKAKKGSGITDLSRLDLIAEYFDMPLESLLFGKKDGMMEKYYGDKLKLEYAGKRKKIPKNHKDVLNSLMGPKTDSENGNIDLAVYQCGPYTIYGAIETLYHITGAKDGQLTADFAIPKLHLFCFYGSEIIAVLTAALTTVMQHVFQPHLLMLQQMIPCKVLDVTDVWRTLNPYWALWQFSEGEPEHDEYEKRMAQRMDELRAVGEGRPVLYIQSIYVRDDCRRNGICRLLIDTLRMAVEDGDEAVIWLNMEPTAGQELNQEYEIVPAYSVSELGQLELNASIAEHLGFTVDPDTWHLQASVLDENGNPVTRTVEKRKCAYFLPKAIREIVSRDGNLVAVGRAKQQLVQEAMRQEIIRSKGYDPGRFVNTGETLTPRFGNNDGWFICEVQKENPEDYSRMTVYAARREDGPSEVRYGMSRSDVLTAGFRPSDRIEQFASLDQALDSRNSTLYKLLNDFLKMGPPKEKADILTFQLPL